MMASLTKDKRKEGTHLLEPKKTYATDEFAIVKWWLCAVFFGPQPCDCSQASRLTDRLKFRVSVIFFLYPAACKYFLVFNAVLDVRWSNIIP